MLRDAALALFSIVYPSLYIRTLLSITDPSRAYCGRMSRSQQRLLPWEGDGGDDDSDSRMLRNSERKKNQNHRHHCHLSPPAAQYGGRGTGGGGGGASFSPNTTAPRLVFLTVYSSGGARSALPKRTLLIGFSLERSAYLL
jgi:hypothetical protein